MSSDDWNERFSKASQIVDKYNNPDNPQQKSHFQTVEIEFGDDSAPQQTKSSSIKKLYEPDSNINIYNSHMPPSQPDKTEKKNKNYSYDLDGIIFINCKIEEWNKGFTLFNDFLRDAKKYYRRTCINANYIYYFSYRPMYRELSHEQLCWYLFWRSRIREGTYLKTCLSYIFLYIYEQINLSDIIGCEKVYANIINIWKNYRAEHQRIDKYIAEWLIDFSFINKIKIDLNDIEDILPDVLNLVTIPEVYLRDDFFGNKNNADLILKNLSVYDYKKSKFYNDKNEKNKELFDYHTARILHEVLSCPEFDEIIKKEMDDGVKIRTTRESFMGAVCVYEHKKRITIEYKNLYKNFFIRQCITDTVRYAENIIRDYLNIKSKLTVTAYPKQLKKVIEDYRNKYLMLVKSPKISVKSKGKKNNEEEELPAPVEFNPNVQAAAEIEKSSWDTTMTLVELQNRDNKESIPLVQEFADEEEIEDVVFEGDESGEFIAIDTGSEENEENYEELEKIAPDVDVTGTEPDFEFESDEDIFDVLETLETPEIAKSAINTETDMGKFVASLTDEEYKAFEILINAKSENKSFDILCVEYLNQNGGMLESIVDIINGKAMDFTGDIIFDTASQEIIEDYREEVEKYFGK